MGKLPRGSTVQSSFHDKSLVLVWLDALEKDFDKAFVDLDQLVGEVDSDQVCNLQQKDSKYFCAKN